MIADAIQRYGLRSIMDVGACWGVNGGYAFHALENGVERAAILDGHITGLTRTRAAAEPRTSLHEGNLGDQAFIEALPSCNGAILYDVLLHQVDPNWDEFLELYATKVDRFIIFNEDFVLPHTTRLYTLGAEWYMANTPEGRDQARVLKWYREHNETVPWLGRPWRDAHHFWQWGITPDDLMDCMRKLGFRLNWFNDFGPLSDRLRHIRFDGYLFSRP